MDPFAAIGAALSVGGFVSNLMGGSDAADLAEQQNNISKQIAGNSKKENDLRSEAATNDYLGATRQAMRSAQVARAQALAAATNQGAAKSTALQGAYGQISGQSGENIAGLTGDYQAGQQIFQLDNKNADLQTQYNRLGGKIQLAQNQGSGLMSLGASIVGNSDKLTNSFSGIASIFAGL